VIHTENLLRPLQLFYSICDLFTDSVVELILRGGLIALDVPPFVCYMSRPSHLPTFHHPCKV
jgi:hypothetical protein